jgi:hypothetical protein
MQADTTSFLARKLMAIAWPAFLAACVLQAVVFSLVDPLELMHSLAWSRQAVYAAAFGLFWAAAMLSSALTSLVGSPPKQAGEAG